MKSQARSEKDPASGQSVVWKGALLQDLIDKSMEELPPELRAQVDLLVLKGKGGVQAVMPRSVVVKYPVLVAWERNAQPIGLFQSVAPWTSRPRILQEGLPVETYFVSQLERVELTNFREKFQGVYLKRRTDPVAMRGEKLFVQNCVACHATGTRGALPAGGHPAVRGPATPRFNPTDRRYLVSYLEARRGEGDSASRPSKAPARSPYLPRQQ